MYICLVTVTFRKNNLAILKNVNVMKDDMKDYASVNPIGNFFSSFKQKSSKFHLNL